MIIEPGDEVRFEPIGAAEFERLAEAAERGDLVAEIVG